jgi:hypothetical protein
MIDDDAVVKPFIDRLLELTYKRELELEKKIEKNLKPEMKWWLEDLKNFNIQLQIACLERKEKIRYIGEIGIRLQ